MKYFTRKIYEDLQPKIGVWWFVRAFLQGHKVFLSESFRKKMQAHAEKHRPTWDKALEDYKRRLEEIKEKLPVGARYFLENGFHDAVIEAVGREGDNVVLELALPGGCCCEGDCCSENPDECCREEECGEECSEGCSPADCCGESCDCQDEEEAKTAKVVFSGVTYSSGLQKCEGDDWLYEELDLSEHGAFELRVLCLRSEFVIAAADLRVEGEVSQEDTSASIAGEP